jgi:adenine phosphoribosyltransferase
MSTNNKKTHQVKINGVIRDLPIINLGPISIAYFDLMGDVAVTEAAAAALVKKLPTETELIVTPEAKSIALAQAMGRLSELDFVVARKTLKPTMGDALSATVNSITTGKPQTLYIDEKSKEKLNGKKIVLLDDVVSTGSTIEGLKILMEKAGAVVVGVVAIFTEGDKDKWREVISLGHLPIFEN